MPLNDLANTKHKKKLAESQYICTIITRRYGQSTRSWRQITHTHAFKAQPQCNHSSY